MIIYVLHATAIWSQCTFWCSVLSDTAGVCAQSGVQVGSQCTFWCSVLSDWPPVKLQTKPRSVSMHLLVLSAFRHRVLAIWLRAGMAVSMHLLVLSAFRHTNHFLQVDQLAGVSMHLLVLSAFRRGLRAGMSQTIYPSQCTFWCSVLSDVTGPLVAAEAAGVSMHLLVLSAFRLRSRERRLGRCAASQCTFWCSVLSDLCKPCASGSSVSFRSQCTFWCSVLSDKERAKARRERNPSLNAPFGAQCFPTDMILTRAPSA